MLDQWDRWTLPWHGFIGAFFWQSSSCFLGRSNYLMRCLLEQVKEWAKVYNINNPKSGTLNSYSLCLLVVFHFQVMLADIVSSANWKNCFHYEMCLLYLLYALHLHRWHGFCLLGGIMKWSKVMFNFYLCTLADMCTCNFSSAKRYIFTQSCWWTSRYFLSLWVVQNVS